ncbi:hypothetical protein MMC10_002886 [Thelotrema lepadinum]|nr:hypothetical protein [Thelotrema lepadinum]
MSLLPEYEKTWEVVERSQDGKTTTSTLVDPQSNETQSSLRLDNSNDEIQVEKTATPAQPVDISVQQIGTTPVLNTDADLEDVEDEVAPLSMQKIMDVTEMGTRNGDSIITRSRRFRKPKQKKEKFHSYIALCRRKLNDVGMIVSIDLEVNSPILRRAFAEVLKNVERINLDADPIVIPKPFEVLWYRWDKMMEYYEKMKGKPGEKELAKIVEFIEANLEDIRKEYKKNVTYGKITSAIAWTIFQPGEIICTNKKSSSPTQCFEVRDCKTVPGGLEIKCSTCQFNGRAFGYSKQLILITLPTNAGSYPITDLNVYPLKYMSDADDMKKRLIERGHRYAQIVRRAHLNYK